MLSGNKQLPELILLKIIKVLFQYKDHLSGKGIPIIKVRQSHLYNGNSYTGKTTSLIWNRHPEFQNPSYPYNGNSYTGKTTSLYWNKHQDFKMVDQAQLSILWNLSACMESSLMNVWGTTQETPIKTKVMWNMAPIIAAIFFIIQLVFEYLKIWTR